MISRLSYHNIGFVSTGTYSGGSYAARCSEGDGQQGCAGRVRVPTLEANEGVLLVSHFAKCFLLLLRSTDDLPRACREVGEFLAFHQARIPTVSAQQDRRLAGIWVDPLVVDAPPQTWGSGSTSNAHQFRMSESVGVNGIWQLCWLDAAHDRESADFHTIRETLVSALIKERPPRPHLRTLQFVPVFDPDDNYHFILLQTERLRELFPGLIGEPMTWNRTTGALATLTGAGERG